MSSNFIRFGDKWINFFYVKSFHLEEVDNTHSGEGEASIVFEMSDENPAYSGNRVITFPSESERRQACLRLCHALGAEHSAFFPQEPEYQ